MKSTYLLFLLLSLFLAGCGGDNHPVNEGKDKPVQTKNEKEKDK
jgi:PBP1b-binding outer membrane lipoprotein LpoB